MDVLCVSFKHSQSEKPKMLSFSFISINKNVNFYRDCLKCKVFENKFVKESFFTGEIRRNSRKDCHNYRIYFKFINYKTIIEYKNNRSISTKVWYVLLLLFVTSMGLWIYRLYEIRSSRTAVKFYHFSSLQVETTWCLFVFFKNLTFMLSFQRDTNKM